MQTIQEETTIFRDYTVPQIRRVTGGHNADCRENRRRYGNLFSWCAVVRFQNELCPAPWRVPTTEDFKTLNTTLGGEDVSVAFGYNNERVRNNYLNIWGADYGGWCTNEGELRSQGFHAVYWSQSRQTPGGPFSLFIHSNGNIIPQNLLNFSKFLGLTLRCVQDN